jgi:hypothetical protein
MFWKKIFGGFMDTELQLSPTELTPGLALIRRRRWYLWGAILFYLPGLKLTLMFSPSLQVVLSVVGLWLLLSFSLAFFAALARCPRCGHYFHMHGPTLLFLRNCLHCQLHLCADRQS